MNSKRLYEKTAKKFAENELPGKAREIEVNNIPPSKDLLKKYSDLGFLGVNLPTKFGGAGLSHFEAVLVLEEIAKISIAIAFPYLNQVLVLHLLFLILRQKN